MDRSVRDWKKTSYAVDPLSEEDVYKAATIHGVDFSGRSTHTFDSSEIVELAKRPPVVSYHEYSRLRKLSHEQLILEFPVLSLFPHYAKREAFEYATRKRLDHPRSDTIVERWKKYHEMSHLGKILMERLHGGKREYVLGEVDSLEKWIESFDDHIGDRDTLLKIANRMGIDSTLDVSPDVTGDIYHYLYDLIDNHLTVAGNKVSITINRYRDAPKDPSQARGRTFRVTRRIASASHSFD